MWAAYRRKEIQVDCHVSVSKPIEVKADKLPDKVEKMSVEAEQIEDKILKVSFKVQIVLLSQMGRYGRSDR